MDTEDTVYKTLLVTFGACFILWILSVASYSEGYSRARKDYVESPALFTKYALKDNPDAIINMETTGLKLEIK